MSTPAEHHKRVSRLAAALAGFGLTAAAAWIALSGFHDVPAELYTSRSNVEFSLPYRGLCRGLSVTVDGRPIRLGLQDIHSGLARFTVPLTAGQHELSLRFDTLLPGLERSYPMTVVVDQTPPPLLLTAPATAPQGQATIEATLLLQGQAEKGARVFVNTQQIAVDGKGGFQDTLPLREGWNHLMVRAEDRAGNRAQQKLSLFRDVKDPEITWHTAPGHPFPQKQARLELSISDDGPLAGVTGKVDGRPVVWHRKPEDRWLGVTEPLPDGRHQVELRVADRAGRVATSQREFLVDSSETLGETELILGARGEDVSLLHRRLREAGYLQEELGSVFTAATKKALEMLQADEGFAITGIADQQTLVALGPRLVVNLSQFSLVLERPGQPDRRWTVAAGAPDFPTPTGRFVVHEKVLDPSWLPPDSDWAKDAKPVEPGPDNPLGTRWIGLDWGGVGIHGTNAPWTVGSAASHGCIRMETSQVEELFSLVEVGTPVVILGGWEDDPLISKFWP